MFSDFCVDINPSVLRGVCVVVWCVVRACVRALCCVVSECVRACVRVCVC